MRKSRPTQRQPPPKRHTFAEQDLIIARFSAAREKGIQPAAAIAGLETSLATVYRWMRARNPAKYYPPPTHAQEVSIESAIARLADDQNEDRLTYLEALFKFIAWLRWPNLVGEHPAAITVCVIAYLSGSRNVSTVDQLNSDDRSLLHRHLRLDVLKSAFSDEVFIYPSFKLWNIEGTPITQLDMLANIAWFLVAYQPPTSKLRDAASLNKAYHAIQAKLFRYSWPISHRTFRTVWLSYGAASPFHYIERFHPTLEFTLDPSSPDFTEIVDELFLKRAELRRYLARCRGIVDLLNGKLDRRALLAVRFPVFPASLVSEVVEPPSLPILTDQIMREFGRGDKR
ncbi:hypothetical protein FPV16_07955 [Methylobacterium sp. W2]|uniref:hypothetical protein n=1 Tax=Methylobacterium sp. W2 TaxID=2598107 RepID=UPI001D0C6768|nr:hypothetical protein [Methylobacterium sp. W2]MCC0806148.1 hypothetical protein [Methylobacterium sp. W2]